MLVNNRFVKLIFILFILIILCLGLMFEVKPASAATIVVDWEPDDNTPGDGHCTLREAITNALTTSGDTTNGDCVAGSSGADTITLPEGLYTLTSQLPGISNSEIVINGNDSLTTIIQASICDPISTPGGCTPADYRIFSIETDGELTLNNLTLRYGDDDYGGAISSEGGILHIMNSIITRNEAEVSGGAIFIDINSTLDISATIFDENGCYQDGGGIDNNGGTITISNNTIFDHNAANYYGGGIYNEGTLIISGTTFINNEANYGGGISCDNNTNLEITDSTLRGNFGFYRGGGIDASTGSSLILSNITLSENFTEEVGDGGGIFLEIDASLEMTNCTLSGNMSNNGGGIYNNADSLYITNSTFSDNQAAVDGGGIYNNGVLNYTNTIIANSLNGGDCVNLGSIGTNVSNLVEDGSCSAALSVDPLLGTLADNGGFTFTHALLEGSPAIDTGDLASCPGTDQRGVTRPQGSECDIGAYEFEQDNFIFLPLILK